MHGASNSTMIEVLDAKTMKVVEEVRFDYRITQTLHGRFYEDALK